MENSKITNQDGFTLIEVLVAMIILTMSLLVLLNMGMVALDGNDWSSKTTVATQLMQQKLENLRSSGNPSSGADSLDGVQRSWTVSSVGNHLKRVDITVTWEDIRNNTRTNTLSSYVKTDSL